jgi:ribosomal protein S18 acetylase RimI-like enzyme
MMSSPAHSGAPPAPGGEHAENIRPLRRDDRAPLHCILQETGVFTDDEIDIALELLDVTLDVPDQEDYVIFAYEERGEVLGYYCVGPTPGTEGTFDLYWIAVNPAAHGKGVGTRLIAHAEAFVAGRGGRLLIAETSSRPHYKNTRMFYIRRGYGELARIRDYYRSGDDLVVYGKYLSQ